MKLISDEEIDKAVKGQRYYAETQVGNSWLRDRAIAQAQLESCEKERDDTVREIFEEIEERETRAIIDEVGTRWHSIKDKEYQSLKSKYLKK